MTIAVGVACPEGIVLAADSRASIVASGYFRVVTDYARKLFALDDRFGIATFGWGFLEGNTVGGAMEEFAAQTKQPKDVGTPRRRCATTSAIASDGTSRPPTTSLRRRAMTSSGSFGTPGGFPTGGGTAEVLAVTDRGLEWIQRTTLRPAVRGPSGGPPSG